MCRCYLEHRKIPVLRFSMTYQASNVQKNCLYPLETTFKKIMLIEY